MKMIKTMKELVSIMVLSMVMVPSVNAQEIKPDIIQKCIQISKLSGAIMYARQDGMPMGVAFEIASESEDESFKDLAHEIILEAFSQPIYRTEAMKSNEISEFSNTWMLECIKIGREMD